MTTSIMDRTKLNPLVEYQYGAMNFTYEKVFEIYLKHVEDITYATASKLQNDHVTEAMITWLDRG